MLSSKKKVIFGWVSFMPAQHVGNSLQGQVRKGVEKETMLDSSAQQRGWLGMLQSRCLQPHFFNAGTLYIL